MASERLCLMTKTSIDPRHLSLVHVVEKLAHKTSLMVEGGASVISAFLASGVVDLVVVTIAPVFVGEGLSMYHEGRVGLFLYDLEPFQIFDRFSSFPGYQAKFGTPRNKGFR